MSIVEELERLRVEGLSEVERSTTLAELEAARIRYLGKKGLLTPILRGMSELPPEERPAVGKVSNEVREALEHALAERGSELADAALEARVSADAVDVTLPGRAHLPGRQHLISNLTSQIIDVFIGLGYKVAEGPEVELDYYNFTALNHAPEHPARSATDTFYVRDLSESERRAGNESDVLLRTHTSPVQIRVLEREEPPIHIICPGQVYRRDIADPSHLPQFTQVEGLVVDEGITLGDLKGTLDHFVREIFGPERRTRFRPHFFPFTEPSAEVDVSCGICEGAGCRFCKNTGWLEILGCGMVDPNVFGYVGVDPERYTGFAFGMGVERIAALKYNIPDVRMLLEGDMRFVRQF